MNSLKSVVAVGVVALCWTFGTAAAERPNIIFVLADDVGWSDFGYNYPGSPIPTPFIDELASRGVQLKQYYSHAVCTPARASLMTGRYHVNTGLTYVLTPGTPGGLSPDIPSLPASLKNLAGYSTAMSGKWHLGHAQQHQTPIGRGFDSFTGIYMWDTDSYTKEIYGIAPWKGPTAVDWVQETSDGKFRHYAEPEHSTKAITEAAQEAIAKHVAASKEDSPLFLYVAYTAAHSPLQPMPGHIEKCAHVVHQWRREFCGMVVGLDEGVRNLTNTALSLLGENTLMVVTSDNGGSPWFGGMNTPLRGTKTTPFEGGTRVPALVVDFTKEQHYLGGSQRGVRHYNGLMHVSDWMPTLLSLAGVPAEQFPEGLDGFNFADVLSGVPIQSVPLPSATAAVGGVSRHHTPEISVIEDPAYISPRSELLYEMYYSDDFMYPETVVAYRIGDFKYVRGIIKDTNYYTEPLTDQMALSSGTTIAKYTEKFIRFLEIFFGSGPFDTLRIVLTHVALADSMTKAQREGTEATVRLYNIIADPTESQNLAGEPWAADIIRQMEERLEQIKANRKEPTQKVWLHLEQKEFRAHHLDGDCSMNKGIAPKNCKFTHPWVANDADPWAFEPEHTVHALDFTKKFFKETIKQIILIVAATAWILLVIVYLLCTKVLFPRKKTAAAAASKKKN